MLKIVYRKVIMLNKKRLYSTLKDSIEQLRIGVARDEWKRSLKTIVVPPIWAIM